jgi:3-dehydroquinate synthase
LTHAGRSWARTARREDAVNLKPLTVRVGLGERAYDIRIGTGTLVECGPEFRAAIGPWSHTVVIADENVLALAQTVVESLAELRVRSELLPVAPGEASKSIDTAAGLWQQMLACGTDRRSLIVAVGGGVIGDLAGFVAATFARGLRFCQVPTSLLAQVDSSVGGKTGINLPSAKNMVGVFWQPSLVLIDTEVLTGLPEREFRSGLAEIVKYGAILDADFFGYLADHVEQLTARDGATLRHVIAHCCRLKADVVEADEREVSGRRTVLNYGHTFAHALESVVGYGQLLHGEAVSIGLVCAARLAERLGRIPADVSSRQVQLLTDLGLPTRLPTVSDERLWQAMSHDKKVEHGQLRFVLPDRLGHVELVEGIDRQHVLQVLAEGH